MPAAGKVFSTAVETTDFSYNKTEYKLATRLEFYRAKDSNKRILNSVLWVEGRFALRQEDEAIGRNVGHLYAYKVDKEVETPAGRPLWLTEVRANNVVELKTVLQELYTAAGNVRRQVTNWANDLTANSILYVDTLVLNEDARGTGLSRVAMQAFHRLLPKVSNGFEYTGTVVLSPAASSDFRDISVHSDLAIEKALVKLYGGVGYEVWLEGNEQFVGSVTIMGLIVAADDVEEEEDDV